jgi:Tol biopolymer transport system component
VKVGVLLAAAIVGLPSAPASGSARVAAVDAGCDRFGMPPVADPNIRDSGRPFLSPDGRFVVFMSRHPLVPDDTNAAPDVYRLDRATGEILRLNLEKTGGELRHGGLPTSVSDDADRVLFWTGSPDIAGEQSNGQVYVRRVSAGKTELVTANVDGKVTNGPVAADADISGDGRWVAFTSQGTDLVASDPRPRDRFATSSDVYLRDLASGTTEAVTSPFGTFTSGTHSFTAAISGDGRFVAFSSGAPWTVDDTSESSDAFVWDRLTKRYELVSVDPAGRAMGGTALAMSDDANLVAFRATDLDGEGSAIFLRDRAARTTRRLHDQKRSSDPSVAMSGDGGIVAIQTTDPVDVDDTDGRDDILLVDTGTGGILPVVAADRSCGPDAAVSAPDLSGDGRFVVVETGWDDLGPAQQREIFLFDAGLGTWTQITPQVIESERPGGDGPSPGGDQPGDDPMGQDPSDDPPFNGADPGRRGTVDGYWMLTAGGEVHDFGGADEFGHGEIGASDIEPTPGMDGYWILHIDGLVTAHGNAPVLGDAELEPDEIATTLSATPGGHGYWVFTTNGRVLSFGDARFLGDMSGVTLNGPVLDSVATPTGRGYFMVAADGGIFAFGDARFAGSMGGRPLNRPVISMAPDPDGRGYWLVSDDGGIFAFDAPFFGSMGHLRLNQPVTGVVPAARGYLMVAADGGIFAFGDIPFHGSLGANPPPDPVIAAALRRS